MAEGAALVVRVGPVVTTGCMGKAAVPPVPALTAAGAATIRADGLPPGWGLAVAAAAAEEAVSAAAAAGALPIHGRPAWAAAVVEGRCLGELLSRATQVHRQTVPTQTVVTPVHRITTVGLCLYIRQGLLTSGSRRVEFLIARATTVGD